MNEEREGVDTVMDGDKVAAAVVVDETPERRLRVSTEPESEPEWSDSAGVAPEPRVQGAPLALQRTLSSSSQSDIRH